VLTKRKLDSAVAPLPSRRRPPCKPWSCTRLEAPSLGADQYVDYTQEDVAQAVRDVDFALDTVGGETTESLVPTLGQGAILVTIAAAPPEEAARERGARAEMHIASPNPEQLARIGELVAAGQVRVEISHLLALTEVRRAHELSESGHTRGKIVLVPGV
jgi:NADPH:quinone reductase-like Zn-dependent oxidoreductase